MLSGRPSSLRLSFSLLVIMLTVSSTFGLVLLLLLSCCSSVPEGAATFWSLKLHHVSVVGLEPLYPLGPPSDCFSFSSGGTTAAQRNVVTRKLWPHESKMLTSTIQLQHCFYQAASLSFHNNELVRRCFNAIIQWNKFSSEMFWF